MMLVVRGGEVFGPEPLGRTDILAVRGEIARVGIVDADAIRRAGFDVEIIDASGAIVVPGLVDGHEHLLGGSGERGFASQTPEIFLHEVVTAGITTVVGCLGVDTTTKTMPGLLAKVRAFGEEGLGAYLYTGGYQVPPTTLTGSVRNDMLLVPEVVGVGEIALADRRGTQPTLDELARLACDAHAGSLLTGRAGVVHFHLGDGPDRLTLVRRLLDERDIDPTWLYPTHVQRNEPLLREAIELTKRGVTVDLDTVDEDLAPMLKKMLEAGVDLENISASSDAAVPSPRTLFDQVRSVVREGVLPLERALRLVTTTPARVLRLSRKGRIAVGADADVVVLERDSLAIRDVVARGRQLVREGQLAVVPKYLERSNRRIDVHGAKG